MTALRDIPAIPGAEVVHPLWCSPGDECSGPLEGYMSCVHVGEVSTWETPSDTRLTLALVRYDDYPGRQVPSKTRARLIVEDTGSMNLDGSKIVAETDLEVADIDVLVRFLGQFRRKLAHDDSRYDVTRDKLGT